MLRTINENQSLILTHIPRVPTSITSVLRELSKRFQIPLSTLKRNAQILKELNLITYGDVSNFKGVELTGLGRFISSLVVGEEPTLLGNVVNTNTGLRPLGTVIKDLRKTVLRMIAEANTGHLGASLSSIELLAVLYFIKMRHDPENPDWPDRDRFILSKGHAAPALYAVLAELGYIKKSDLSSLRELGSGLQGHPDIRLPGVDASTGSLGHGLSIANGMAIAGKMDGSDRSVYVLLGDGELGEGSIWEAALTASHQGLGNLVAIVDRNDYQLTARTKEVKGLEPISDKWISFGWNVIEAEGNEPDSVLDALDQCTMNREKPNVIIARTTKGKGVSFMEGNRFSNRIPKAEELREALSQLS